MLILSARRAWNISSEVKPWSAERRRRAPESSVGDSSASATNVPAPCFDWSIPTVASERIPARSVGQLTPRSFARSRSGGSQSPARSIPLWIISRRRETTSSALVPFLSELRLLKMPGLAFGIFMTSPGCIDFHLSPTVVNSEIFSARGMMDLLRLDYIRKHLYQDHRKTLAGNGSLMRRSARNDDQITFFDRDLFTAGRRFTTPLARRDLIGFG